MRKMILGFPVAIMLMAASAQAQGAVWSATFTPGDINGYAFGCRNGDDDAECSNKDVLSDDTFTVGEIVYTVTEFYQTSGTNRLYFAGIRTPEDGTSWVDIADELKIGSTSLDIGDAFLSQGQNNTSAWRLRWSGDRGLDDVLGGDSLTDGTSISVTLISGDLPPPPPPPTTPGAPTGLAATANGPSQIDLAWTAPASTGGSAITGYKIEVSPDGSSWSDLVADTGSTDTAYAHMGLDPAATRHYRVSAINAVGTSNASDSDDTTTASTNFAPTFTEGTSTTRSVAENTASGQNIGAPVTATDTDTSDTLTYTLGGTDAADFGIVRSSGQLQTSAALDFETKDSYAVTVSVSDGNGGADSIDVTINVTNVDEPNFAPTFTEGTSTTRSVAENTASGQNIGAPVTATDTDTSDTLTYTLGGTDAADFGIVRSSGQLQTSAALDFETKDSYAVTVSVSDGNGGADSIDVTINVTADRAAEVADAPTNLLAVVGDGQVVLTWDAPEDDGGAVITDYEYRIGQRGDWISIGSTATTHTVTGLVNGTTYVFQVRAVNRIGRSGPSLPAEATPIAQVVLDLAHFANGAGIISEVVLVNVAPHPIRPALYFYDQEGEPIAAESMVDVLGDLGIQEDGGLTIRTEMEPLGELTISTHGRGDLVSGSVKVAAYGTIGGVLRFDLSGIGVAGVQVSQPLRDAIFPVRRREGGIDTGMALHNREEEAAVVSCRLMKNGAVLEEVEIPLAANGQVARFIGEVFTATDTSDFVGLVRCTAEGVAQFTGMALELDAGNRIFTTLPVVEVNRGRAGEAALDFAHFANGASIVSEMVFMNLETQPSGPPPTPFHQAIPPTRPVIYFYDTEGNPIDPALLVDLTGDLVVTEDGALSIQSEMEPLGELTISTYGRGELVSGSVKVVSEGPIGGVLRFDIPGIGVAGVGASQPVRDAIFPARRQAGGISTGAAIHNLGEEALVVSCQLMKAGAVLEEEEISLEANGQEARYIEEMFTSTDTSDFVGSVRCTAPPGEGMFTGVAVELDADNRIFTTLPVVPVPERMSQE